MASSKSPAYIEEAELRTLVAQLIDAPEHADNPLREPLVRLASHCEGQRERLERLVRISDGYHSISRDQRLSLAEQYDKQLRRLDKLARISDRYQNSLRELSEALKESASRDPLTGMDNRRALTERLREESERATRKHLAYGLAILDVDRFKLINDRFGHDVGDKALCAISEAIRDSLREYDACGRWGGEEFLILLPETPSEYALQVIERVRVSIQQIRIDVPENQLPLITASFGLTLYRPGENYSDTISRADTLLRVAKTQGRNRVIVD